jgi:hypothetical protein
LKRLRALLLLVPLLLLLAVPAKADAVTDTLEVCVGYFGWTEDQYVQKAKYTWQQLDDAYGGALSTQQAVYSYYNGSRTYLVLARGFYLRDLFEYAGVDLGSVASIDFFTKDHTNGAYRSFTKGALFDTPRYYFPNIAASEDTGQLYAFDGGGDLWTGAGGVEPMLALEDYSEWDAAGSEFEQRADPSLLGTANRFHLLFGQSAPDEVGTSSAAKYVYKILVTYSGTPVLTQDETNLDLTVGSDRTLKVAVSAEDELLNDYVSSHIAWSSSDEHVVKVDQSGHITVVGSGDASVTASFGKSTAVTKIHVAADASETKTAGAGTGTGTGSGSGAGAGTGTKAGGGAGADAGTQSAAAASSAKSSAQSVQTAPAEQPEAIGKPDSSADATPSRGVYILAPGAMAASSGQAGTAGTEPMGGGAQQLVLKAPEKSPYLLPASLALLLSAVLGFFFGVLRYKKLK